MLEASWWPSTTWTSVAPSTTPTAAWWTFWKDRALIRARRFASVSVGSRFPTYYRYILRYSDEGNTLVPHSISVPRGEGRGKQGRRVVQRVGHSLSVLRGNRCRRMRRARSSGMRQHRPLRHAPGSLHSRPRCFGIGFVCFPPRRPGAQQPRRRLLCGAPRAHGSRMVPVSFTYRTLQEYDP